MFIGCSSTKKKTEEDFCRSVGCGACFFQEIKWKFAARCTDQLYPRENSRFTEEDRKKIRLKARKRFSTGDLFINYENG
jgi:hypothetical protein